MYIRSIFYHEISVKIFRFTFDIIRKSIYLGWKLHKCRYTTHLDTTGVADIIRIHHDFEGRIGDVFAAALDRHQMFAHLPGSKGDSGVACKLDE